MTPEQELHELRKALAIDERLAGLLANVAKNYADTALRKQYLTNDAAALIRQAGMAEGVEDFLKHITKPPIAEKR